MSVSRTVKEYERPQASQQSAKIMVMRQETVLVPPVSEIVASETVAGETLPSDNLLNPPLLATEISQGEVSASQELGATPPLGDILDFPSGNEGLLAQASDGVVYRTVKVRKGDTLERLLRREGMDSDLIYRHLLAVTLKLNPQIKNADLIFAGAEIKIPASGVYLNALAGVNHEEVREAAARAASGRKAAPLSRTGQGNDSNVLNLPSASVETAKNTLGFIFTSLGERVNARGSLILPAGADTIDIDTAVFPVVELQNGIKIVVDLESRLPQKTITALRTHYPQYMVFRTRANEPLEKALDRLWPLCGYYRIYKNDRSYEGGTDIKLKLTADWLIWTTGEAWNLGQPLVINLASGPDKNTDMAFSNFLNNHGIKIIDLYKGNLLPGPDLASLGKPLAVVELNSSNPAVLAAELAKQIGFSVKIGLPPNWLDFPPALGGAPLGDFASIVLEKEMVVLNFGEISPEMSSELAQGGYKILNVSNEAESAISAVLTGLKVENDLTISAKNGPKI
ncbi:MAG: hypothetical protein ACRCTY_01310, partial [Candidatus Adiutrix sp.]